jgi:transposase
MSMGKRAARKQESLWVSSEALRTRFEHPFYRALNGLLAKHGFDPWVEQLCEGLYSSGKGRPSIPPGVYFRMLFVGYFEGISSQRAIAARCEDSLSLRRFLGIDVTAQTPDHSTLTVIAQRLPEEVEHEVFKWVLKIAAQEKLFSARTLGIDSTQIEANAAMTSVVRRDTGERYQKWLARVRAEAAVKAREKKDDEDSPKLGNTASKTSQPRGTANDNTTSTTDPDAGMARMSDGRTRLTYKVDHVVDLDHGIVVHPLIRRGGEHDAKSLIESVTEASAVIEECLGGEARVEEVVVDRGYYTLANVLELTAQGITTYMPEQRRRGKHKWVEQTEAEREVLRANEARVQSVLGRKLAVARMSRVEPIFAHVCRTGGSGRTWLRGIERVTKRYLCTVAAFNLGRIMRSALGVGTPRGLRGLGAIARALRAVRTLVAAVTRTSTRLRLETAAANERWTGTLVAA